MLFLEKNINDIAKCLMRRCKVRLCIRATKIIGSYLVFNIRLGNNRCRADDMEIKAIMIDLGNRKRINNFASAVSRAGECRGVFALLIMQLRIYKYHYKSISVNNTGLMYFNHRLKWNLVKATIRETAIKWSCY